MKSIQSPKEPARHISDHHGAKTITSHRPEALAQRKSLELMQQSRQVQEGKVLQQKINAGARQQVAQRYWEGTDEANGDGYRVSDKNDVAVKQRGGGIGSNFVYLASDGHDSFVAANLPWERSGGDVRINGRDFFQVTFDVRAENDCGVYALQVMRAMYAYNRREHESRMLVDTQEERTANTSPENIFPKTPPNAVGQIGDAFYVINPPDLETSGNQHFNFHWAAIVGKSGSDVLTSERASTGDSMWFQLYNHDPGNFASSYITAGKLSERAKAFIARLELSQKKEKKPQNNQSEMVILDDSE